jgi:hypothetical protein
VRSGSRALLFGLAALALNAHAPTQAQARELQTDRPTRTESPWTVEPGRVQLETGVFQLSRDESRNTYGLATNTLVKAGVLRQADLEVFFDGYNIEQNGARGTGNLGLRLKINLYGNDSPSPDTALALLGTTGYATGKREFRDRNIGHGGYVLFQTKLPLDHELAITTGYVSRHPVDTDRTSEHVGIVSLARSIVGEVKGFVELASQKDLNPGGAWEAAFDTGLYQKLGENVQLDAGVYIGLTDAAEDLTPFAGLSFRL